jgi:hypothetical protein
MAWTRWPVAAAKTANSTVRPRASIPWADAFRSRWPFLHHPAGQAGKGRSGFPTILAPGNVFELELGNGFGGPAGVASRR